MTLDQSAQLEFSSALRNVDGDQMMRMMLAAMLQSLVDSRATDKIGAGRYERSDTRMTSRNGARPKTVSTTSADVLVKIPKRRAGSLLLSLLGPRRRIEVALHAVIMEVSGHTTCTGKGDDPVAALGVESGISTSQVPRICADLDADVPAFNARDLSAHALR